MQKKVCLNDEKRRQWVDNDEGLYLARIRSGTEITTFVRENRAMIDDVIFKALSVMPK